MSRLLWSCSAALSCCRRAAARLGEGPSHAAAVAPPSTRARLLPLPPPSPSAAAAVFPRSGAGVAGLLPGSVAWPLPLAPACCCCCCLLGDGRANRRSRAAAWLRSSSTRLAVPLLPASSRFLGSRGHQGAGHTLGRCS